MKGFLLLDLYKPVQSSIVVYLFLIIIYLVFFHRKYGNELEDRKFMFPVMVITLSIVIYYIFRLLQFYFT